MPHFAKCKNWRVPLLSWRIYHRVTRHLSKVFSTSVKDLGFERERQSPLVAMGEKPTMIEWASAETAEKRMRKGVRKRQIRRKHTTPSGPASRAKISKINGTISRGSRSQIGRPCLVCVPEKMGSWCNGMIANTSIG